MLSRQILQRTINEMKEIVAAEISLWNAEGMIAVKTSGADESAKEQVKIYLSKWKEQMEEGTEELSEAVEEKAAFFPILNHMSELEYVLMIHGVWDDIKVIGRLCVSQIKMCIRDRKKSIHCYGKKFLLSYIRKIRDGGRQWCWRIFMKYRRKTLQ